MSKSKTAVSIIVGSDSDLKIVQGTTQTLDSFGVAYELKILSAHRTPEALQQYIEGAERRKAKVFIAAAGAAAHLAGVIASHTVLPVIGVPIPSSSLLGLDSLLAIVQMPKGIPVLTTAIGKAGAVNAAVGAVQILAVGDPNLKRKLKQYRSKMRSVIEEKNKALEEKGIDDYVRSKAAS